MMCRCDSNAVMVDVRVASTTKKSVNAVATLRSTTRVYAMKGMRRGSVGIAKKEEARLEMK
jgi:hypothetical protein